MKVSDILKICSDAIPESGGWPSVGENYGPYNVDMNADVKKILYCVTPNPKLLKYFRENGYDLLISHHPFIAHSSVPQLIYHTALDCCEGGLNDMWKDALGVKDARHFDRNLGWVGDIEPTRFKDLVEKVRGFAGDVIGETYVDPRGDDIIRTVVICTGLGGLVVDEAVATEADCYILGENTMPAKDTGFKAVIEVGHTLSEWVGVKLFKKLLPTVQVDQAPFEVDVFGVEAYGCRKSRLVGSL